MSAFDYQDLRTPEAWWVPPAEVALLAASVAKLALAVWVAAGVSGWL